LRSILSGVDCEVAFAWGHPNGFMDTNPSDAKPEIKRYIELSSLFGQGRMRIAASSVAYYDRSHAVQVDTAVKSIKSIIPIARGHGVRLALENHGDFHLHEMLEILDRVDSEYLGITFDTGNSLRLCEDCVASLQAYGKNVLLVHAKDIAPENNAANPMPLFNCVPAGMGITDFKSVFSGLMKNSFNGMVLIEISRLHSSYAYADETEVINDGLKYLKKLREELNENGNR